MIFMATEYVVPLQSRLDSLLEADVKDRHMVEQQRDLYLAWGIFQITVSCFFSRVIGRMKVKIYPTSSQNFVFVC